MFIAPFLILMTGIFGARYISNDASKLLSSEQKVQLVDIYSENKLQRLVFPISLLILYFVLIEFLDISLFDSNIVFAVLIIILGGYSIYTNNMMLTKNGFSKVYIKKIRIAIIIRYLSIASMMSIMWF